MKWHLMTEETPQAGAPVLCQGGRGNFYVGYPVTIGSEKTPTNQVYVPDSRARSTYRRPMAWMELPEPYKEES